MALPKVSGTGDGTTGSNVVQLDFPYLYKTDVKVTVDGEPRAPETLTWLTDSSFRLPDSVAFLNGKPWEARRETSIEQPEVVFQPAGIDYRDLNRSAAQSLFKHQEATGEVSELAITVAQHDTIIEQHAAIIALFEEGTAAPGEDVAVSIRRFGATTASSDNTAAIQATIDYVASQGGGQVLIPPGTFVTKRLTLPSNVFLRGLGEVSVLKAHAALSGGNLIDGLGSNNTGLLDLAVDGNNLGAGPTQTLLTPLLNFRGNDLRFDGLRVSNYQYIGLAVAGLSRRVQLTRSRFTGLGYQGYSTNAGSAVWLATVSVDQTEDVVISGNRFHDNHWHGMHLSAVGAVLSGNIFRNNKEAHLFLADMPSGNLYSRNIAVTGNTFDTVRRKDISAHAIESGAQNITITGNVIRNCDHGGISVTDGKHVTITGNSISNFNQLNPSLGVVNACGIDVICTSGTNASDVNISGNTIFDEQSPATGYAAISIGGPGATPVFTLLANNQVSSTIGWTSGKAIVVQASFGSSGLIARRNNMGSSDFDVKTGQFQAPAAPGNFAVTGVGFRPRFLEIDAVLPNGSTLTMSIGSVDATGSQQCVAAGAQSGGALGTLLGNKIISLQGSGGTYFFCEAVFVSFNADGFTLSFTNTTAQPFIRWKAYP